MKIPCVYILTNKPNGTFYVGVTSDPIKRVWQHRSDLIESFTRRHQLIEKRNPEWKDLFEELV